MLNFWVKFALYHHLSFYAVYNKKVVVISPTLNSCRQLCHLPPLSTSTEIRWLCRRKKIQIIIFLPFANCADNPSNQIYLFLLSKWSCYSVTSLHYFVMCHSKYCFTVTRLGTHKSKQIFPYSICTVANSSLETHIHHFLPIFLNLLLFSITCVWVSQ